MDAFYLGLSTVFLISPKRCFGEGVRMARAELCIKETATFKDSLIFQHKWQSICSCHLSSKSSLLGCWSLFIWIVNKCLL